MHDTESDTDHALEQALHDLYATLDSLEDCLTRRPVANRIGPHAIDLVLRLRREINTLGSTCPSKPPLREDPARGSDAPRPGPIDPAP